MIYSETIEKVYSNVINEQVFSEDVPDYRRLDFLIRETEQDDPRILEDDDKRILE